MQSTDTKGESLSPITAALRTIPLKPVLWDSIELGQTPRMYDAVQMKKRRLMIMLSKLKKALYIRQFLPSTCEVDIN